MINKQLVESILQWSGAAFIVSGNITNVFDAYPYNIWIFLFGSICFDTWAFLVKNNAQLVVNTFTILVCIFGIFKAHWPEDQILYDNDSDEINATNVTNFLSSLAGH